MFSINPAERPGLTWATEVPMALPRRRKNHTGSGRAAREPASSNRRARLVTSVSGDECGGVRARANRYELAVRGAGPVEQPMALPRQARVEQQSLDARP